jgi:hypothetical protein
MLGQYQYEAAQIAAKEDGKYKYEIEEVAAPRTGAASFRVYAKIAKDLYFRAGFGTREEAENYLKGGEGK